MKSLKTIGMVVIVLVLSFSLFACGDKGVEEGSDKSQEASAELPTEIDQATLKANYDSLMENDDRWNLTPEGVAEALGVQGTINKERTDDWNKDADEGVEFAVYNYPNYDADASVTVLFEKSDGGDFSVSSFSPVGLE